MRPTYYRLVVDWSGVAGPSGADVNFARPNPGCMRDVQPCGGYGGVRAQLQALAARQKADPGRWQVLVVLTGTPDALAQAPTGCERAGTQPRSRPPRPDALARYQAFIEALFAEAQRDGAELRYWSPWNEPNHPFGLSPQRTGCSAGASAASPALYARLLRAMEQTLAQQPGDQSLVLGETAGLLRRSGSYVSVGDFIRGLPRDLVCKADVYGQHGYVGGPDPTGAVAAALRTFHCDRTPQIWITETGAGAAQRGHQRSHNGARTCLQIRKRLLRWYDDPRVTAAFQYTLREDDVFPTGLVTTDLTKAYPALKEWQTWGRRDPTDPPPPSSCAG
jgi:hypothetical protein